MGWIPVVAFMGIPFAVVGAFLMYVGRSDFEIVPQRTVAIGLALVVLAAMVASLAAGYVLGFSDARRWTLTSFEVTRAFGTFLSAALSCYCSVRFRLGALRPRTSVG